MRAFGDCTLRELQFWLIFSRILSGYWDSLTVGRHFELPMNSDFAELDFVRKACIRGFDYLPNNQQFTCIFRAWLRYIILCTHFLVITFKIITLIVYIVEVLPSRLAEGLCIMKVTIFFYSPPSSSFHSEIPVAFLNLYTGYETVAH